MRRKSEMEGEGERKKRRKKKYAEQRRKLVS